MLPDLFVGFLRLPFILMWGESEFNKRGICFAEMRIQSAPDSSEMLHRRFSFLIEILRGGQRLRRRKVLPFKRLPQGIQIIFQCNGIQRRVLV